MIIIELKGGLGNQMFQYAIASIIAQKKSATVLIDTNFFNKTNKTQGFTLRNFELSIFNNPYIKASASEIAGFHQLSVISKLKKKLGLNYLKIYEEPSFGFQADALSIKTPVYLKGYFQSYKYYIGNENYIKDIFSFPDDALDSVNVKIMLTIKNANSISIHIRRGDYVQDKVTQEFHGNCSFEYYLNAITLLTSNTSDFKLFFFSDDCDWVKEQFKDLACSKIFIDHNKNEDSWKDMFLMSCCKHNIISNSSFSWWAAWLNKNSEKRVIAPKKWFTAIEIGTNDLIPNEWIRL
jgi:hypothetical protein